MSRLITMFFLGMMYAVTLFGDSSMTIQNAAIEGKYLFIFFYKDQNEKTLRLQNIFEKTMQKMHSQSKWIKIKVDDPSEKVLTERFDLKRSPMPFVMVLAPNGAIMGSFASFTEEQLMDSISSPGAANCLKALQERKLVILCLQNDQTINKEGALKGAKEFKLDPRFSNATEIIIIDPSNEKEHKFLKQLINETHFSQAMTLLISPPAEIIGTYQGSITKSQLIADLEKAASGCCGSSGCCPGGKCGIK